MLTHVLDCHTENYKIITILDFFLFEMLRISRSLEHFLEFYFFFYENICSYSLMKRNFFSVEKSN